MKKEKYSIVSDNKEEEIVVPIPENYKDVAELIKSDYYRRASKIVPVWKIYLQTLKTPNPCSIVLGKGVSISRWMDAVYG